HGVGLRESKAGTVGHRAKDVVDVPHTPANRRFHLLERRVRMSRVAANPLRPTSPNEAFRSAQLRGDRRRANAIAEREILLVLGGNGWPHASTGMSAACFVGEVWPV